MSACQIIGMVVPAVHIHFFLTAYYYFLARIVLGYVGSCGIHVRHHQQNAVGVQLACPFGKFADKAVHTFRVVLVLHDVASEVGHGKHYNLFALLVPYRNYKVVVVYYAPSFAVVAVLPVYAYVSSYLYLVAREECARCFETVGRIVVSGGYGVGSKEGFDQLFQLAKVLHGEVGGSRAAVDAGWIDHDRQIGQTGVTVHPKVYIACGISGQIQHIAGMQDSGIIISINSDPDAPINRIADYVIVGTVEEVVPKLIKYYKQNSK